MIVIGLNVHKQSVTAVAVGEAGRPLGEKLVLVGSEELLGWAAALAERRSGRSRTAGSSHAGWNGSC